MSNISLRLKKAYLKFLQFRCHRHWDSARKLHAKSIGLGLEIRTLEGSIGKLN